MIDISLNAVQVHLFVTHYPTVIATLAFPVLVFAHWRGQRELKLLGLLLVVLGSVFTGLSYLSGLSAMAIDKRNPEMDRSLIYRHWDLAENSLRFEIVLALLAMVLGTLLWKKRHVPAWLWYLFFAAFLAASYVTFVAAYSGGVIHH